MKRIVFVLAVMFLVVGSVGVVNAEWATFVIRENATEGAPLIQDNNTYVAGAKEFVTFASSQKAGWGSDELSGKTIGDITQISIDRLDDSTRFDAGSGPAVAPYFNIWVTDDNGNYAVVANEPSNGEWQPGNNQWDMDWDTLKTKTAKVYENSDTSWIVDSTGGILTFEDLAGLKIEAPSDSKLATGWSGLTGGAPRDLSNEAYAFNWVFGDTLSNYVSGQEGFVVANPVAVPEPSTIVMLLAAGLAAFGVRRFR